MEVALNAPGLVPSVAFFIILAAALLALRPTAVHHARMALAAKRASDGRSGERQTHYRDRTWWETTVPRMSNERFARLFRVPRVVFLSLVAAASTSRQFQADDFRKMLPVDMQVGMGLYKYVCLLLFRVAFDATHCCLSYLQTCLLPLTFCSGWAAQHRTMTSPRFLA